MSELVIEKRRKCVDIEVVRWDGSEEQAVQIIDWLDSEATFGHYREARTFRVGGREIERGPSIRIREEEHDYTVSAGDYVVLEDGYFSAVRADTYESLTTVGREDGA